MGGVGHAAGRAPVGASTLKLSVQDFLEPGGSGCSEGLGGGGWHSLRVMFGDNRQLTSTL